MNIVQFRWVNPKTNKTHIIGQFEIDWKFQIGENFHFWGGENNVQDVQIHLQSGMYGEKDGQLSVTQIVTILPLWNHPELGCTPEGLWGNTTVVGELNESKKTTQKTSLI